MILTTGFRTVSGIAMTMCTIILFGNVFAAEAIFTEPILITSAGQSADVVLMKTIVQKEKLNFVYEPQADVSKLADVKSLILVVGGSTKGLGAAKISAKDELSRVRKLLKAAKEKQMPVLVAHIGGVNRRGALSDEFIQLGAENADRILVVKGGNEDGYFTKIAEQMGVPLYSAEKLFDVGPLVKTVYTVPADSSLKADAPK